MQTRRLTSARPFWHNVLLALVLSALTVTHVGAQLPSWMSTEQTLVILHGLWETTPAALEVRHATHVQLLTDSDIELLQRSLSGGKVWLTGSNASMISPTQSARIIILFTGPLTTAVTLQQPEGAAALYVQRGDEFQRYPADVPLSTRTILIEPTPKQRDVFHLSFDHPLGGRSGGEILIRKQPGIAMRSAWYCLGLSNL